MSILALPHAQPDVILIDWHATLVNTHDAMYHAVDDVLPRLRELGLLERLLTAEQSKTVEDAKLVKYVRDHQRLHPKVVAARKISRTDIFEVLFGNDEDAKRRAHLAFDSAYRQHVGEVAPLEADARVQLTKLRELGIALGLISNRSREFMEQEVARVEEGGWADLFDVMVCGNDVPRRKPAPDMLLTALSRLGRLPSEACWYLGDSTTDVIAAKAAGVTSIFYNGAHWDQAWLDKIFPGTQRHPSLPDAVVTDLPALVAMARHLQAQNIRVTRHREG
ncbi:HAD family hydrolase [Alcanivorax sp. JB21]|uniref:HAD family hydrolase n=1 Tax=Alcanivorax limicola TaxID=2874102 RepID=UPI001CC074C8|nr:HAD-IA family hydrolase [Alcanivorax limicola]MBZ2188367.1 HAD family hydrolase [Alcanivorax limicola]